MLVKDLMSTKVVCVKPDTLISEVAEIMHEHHFRSLPVINDEGTTLGVISDHDFVTEDSNLYLPTYIKLLSSMNYVQGGQKLLPRVVEQISRSTAKDIMNSNAPFATPETTLEQIIVIFAKKQVNLIPVTNSANKLLGVISRSDIIKFFLPAQIKLITENEQQGTRMIDEQVKYAQGQFKSTFAVVAKARANIWLTATVVLFVVGFAVGMFYVADPELFVKQGSKLENN